MRHSTNWKNELGACWRRDVRGWRLNCAMVIFKRVGKDELFSSYILCKCAQKVILYGDKAPLPHGLFTNFFDLGIAERLELVGRPNMTQGDLAGFVLTTDWQLRSVASKHRPCELQRSLFGSSPSSFRSNHVLYNCIYSSHSHFIILVILLHWNVTLLIHQIWQFLQIGRNILVRSGLFYFCLWLFWPWCVSHHIYSCTGQD